MHNFYNFNNKIYRKIKIHARTGKNIIFDRYFHKQIKHYIFLFRLNNYLNHYHGNLITQKYSDFSHFTIGKWM